MRLAVKPRRGRLISLTPLIDVVFILLVFFMLASNFSNWRSIDLSPAGGSGGSLEGAVLIEVRAEGLRVAGRINSLEAISSDLIAKAGGGEAIRVFVKPSQGILLQDVIVVLERLGRIDGVDVSLIRGPNG